MSEPQRSTRRFVVDTNVFVAAIKPFSRDDRESQLETRTLSLLIELIVNGQLELVGNSRLLDEYRRLAEELSSETSRLILGQLIQKTEVVEVDEEVALRCTPYLPREETSDLIHAATALQTGAVVITNDRHFDRIGRSGAIQVWNINEAMRRLL